MARTFPFEPRPEFTRQWTPEDERRWREVAQHLTQRAPMFIPETNEAAVPPREPMFVWEHRIGGDWAINRTAPTNEVNRAEMEQHNRALPRFDQFTGHWIAWRDELQHDLTDPPNIPGNRNEGEDR